MKTNDFQQLAILLETIENMASAGRKQRLRFRNAKGQSVGSLMLESGSILFGVECAGRTYIDPIFASEAQPYASSLIKHLCGEHLTKDELLLLTQLPLRARRALRAVTARALRQLALVCDLSEHAVQSDIGAESPRGLLRVVFSPSELLLVAGMSGDIRAEDPAVTEFEMAPLNPRERWLFECQGEEPCRPWPVMTRLLSVRRISTVIEKGRFCQHLISHLPRLVPPSVHPGPMAALLTLDSQINYVVKTERYVALMIYPLDQRRRLLVALESRTQRGKGLQVQIGEAAIASSLLPDGEVPSLSWLSPLYPSSMESPNAAGVPPVNLQPVESAEIVAANWIELQAASQEIGSESGPVLATNPEVLWEDGPLDTNPEKKEANTISTISALNVEDEQQSQQSWRQTLTADVPSNQSMEEDMALTSNSIKEVMARLENSIDGFIGAAIADSDSGMCLGFIGGGGVLNLEIAAAGNTEVVRAKRKAMKTLNLRDEVEDILITLGKQYHLIRPLRSRANVFIYLAVDRSRANLALARHTLSECERDVVL